MNAKVSYILKISDCDLHSKNLELNVSYYNYSIAKSRLKKLKKVEKS